MTYPYTSGQVVTADDMNSGGLHLITPSSVTNGTLDGAKITVSSSTSVSIDGIFSSDFDHYKIMARVNEGSSPFDLYFQWRTTSGDVDDGSPTTGNYWWAFLGYSYTGVEQRTNDDFNKYGYSGTLAAGGVGATATLSAEIFNPYDSTFRSVLQSQSHINGVGYFGVRTGVSGHRNYQSHTGITFTTTTSDTFSGVFRVYGYSNG